MKKYYTQSILNSLTFLFAIIFAISHNLYSQQVGCNFLCNSDFEDDQLVQANTWGMFNQNNVSCWNTTAGDGLIEFWGDGNGGFNAYSGNQFIELNANVVSTLFQNFTAVPGSSVTISFAHRGRGGTDHMSVSIRPAGGNDIVLDTFSTGNGAWVYYTVKYTFPNNSVTDYSLRFNSLGGGSVGNFLDAISIQLPQPEIIFEKHHDTCGNDMGRIVAFVDSGTAPYSYSWNSGWDTTTVISNLSPGSYTLVVSDAYGCTDSLTDTINNVIIPVLESISVELDEQCQKGNVFQFDYESNLNENDLNFNWNFGDGSNSSSSYPSKSYTNQGSYQVKLRASIQLGCADSLTLPVWVLPSPVATFQINDQEQCFKNNHFEFLNQSSIVNDVLSHKWYFGNIDSSVQASPEYSFQETGQFLIRLISTSSDNCHDTASQLIDVYPMPSAVFTVSDTIMCLKGNQFMFSNQSTIPYTDVDYFWDFGNSESSNQVSPNYTYSQHGNYDVRLIAESEFGCADTTTRSLEVFPSPDALFTVSSQGLCLLGNSFNFTNQSSIAYHSISYEWDFGNGTTSQIASPELSYNNFGQYDVSLISTSSSGCKDTFEQQIEVYPMPEANFIISDTALCLRGNEFTFTNQSSIAYHDLNYFWSIGNVLETEVESPTHSFLTHGSYTIRLIALSDLLCADTSVQTIEVYPTPIAAYTASSNAMCLLGNYFEFDNQSSIAYHTLSYDWDFGNNEVSQDISPDHIYNVHGQYDVRLIATSSMNCKDTLLQQIEVYPMPDADFSVSNPEQCLRENNFAFNNQSSIAYHNLNYLWDFGNNATSQSVSPDYSYPQSGKYTVRLISYTQFACADTFEQNIEVYPMPVSAFTVSDPSMCLLGNNFELTNQSTVSNHSLTYEWIFGTGDTSQAESVNYSYTNHGVYLIRLVSSSSGFGCADTAMQNVEVFPMPVSSFTVSDTGLCLLGNQFDFTNQSTIAYNSLNYQWAFGNGDISTQTSPSYNYNTHGNFQVRLIVNSEHNCADTAFNNIEVYPMPVAQFNISDSAMCLNGNRFQFNNQSTIPYHNMSFDWNLGDGQNSQLTSPVHSYQNEGNYQVTLIVTSDFNCIDSVSRNITVYPRATVMFTADTVCFGNENRFVSQANISSGTIALENWSFGDGNAGVGTVVYHEYKKPGNYIVRLITTSDVGCKDTLEIADAAMVRELPSVDFEYNKVLDSFVITGFKFFNQSSGTSPLDFMWTFDKYDYSQEANPYVEFYDTGMMNIRLEATDDFGCKGEMEKKVYAMPKNKVFIPTAFSPNGDRFNEVFMPIGMPFAKEYEMRIFNRWGELLFTTRHLHIGWDGTFNGSVVQEGLYMYTATILDMHNERHNMNGAFTLLK